MKNQPFRLRLKFAATGIASTFQREASFRTQILLASVAALLLLLLKPPLVWFMLFLMSASAVLALELFNTALEALADRLHPEMHESIRLAKDCAAGAVLLASATALVIGVITVGVSLGLINLS
jgi:undecaprenol kinase